MTDKKRFIKFEQNKNTARKGQKVRFRACWRILFRYQFAYYITGEFHQLDLGKNCHKSTFVRNLTNVITQEGYTFLTIGYTGRKVAPKEEIINSDKIN